MTNNYQTEETKTAFSPSKLFKKSLCDYVINVSTGCTFGCPHCLVPATPMIRTRQKLLAKQGVDNIFDQWGSYMFVREHLPQILEEQLSRKKIYARTDGGQGVFMLSIGCDPYQNPVVGGITRKCVQILLSHNKRVRILTRSPFWLKDLDILCHPDVTVGMSIPDIDEDYVRKFEPNAPSLLSRLNALKIGSKAGCRVYTAIAPTTMKQDKKSFLDLIHFLTEVNPEVIFWELLNPRANNLERMERAIGRESAEKYIYPLSFRKIWADTYFEQAQWLTDAAIEYGMESKIHLWVDSMLYKQYPDRSKFLDKWINKKTSEAWQGR